MAGPGEPYQKTVIAEGCYAPARCSLCRLCGSMGCEAKLELILAGEDLTHPEPHTCRVTLHWGMLPNIPHWNCLRMDVLNDLVCFALSLKRKYALEFSMALVCYFPHLEQSIVFVYAWQLLIALSLSPYGDPASLLARPVLTLLYLGRVYVVPGLSHTSRLSSDVQMSLAITRMAQLRKIS